MAGTRDLLYDEAIRAHAQIRKYDKLNAPRFSVRDRTYVTDGCRALSQGERSRTINSNTTQWLDTVAPLSVTT